MLRAAKRGTSAHICPICHPALPPSARLAAPSRPPGLAPRLCASRDLCKFEERGAHPKLAQVPTPRPLKGHCAAGPPAQSVASLARIVGANSLSNAGFGAPANKQPLQNTGFGVPCLLVRRLRVALCNNQWHFTNSQPETTYCKFNAQCVGKSAWAFSALRIGHGAIDLEGHLHGHLERKMRALQRD